MLRCRRHGIRFSLCRRADIMTKCAKQFGEDRPDEQIVFHQQNSKRVHNLRAPWSRRGMFENLD